MVELIDSAHKVSLMTHDGSFVVFLDGELLFFAFEGSFEGFSLLSELRLFFLFDSFGVFGLGEVAAKVLDLFLLLPKDVTQFVCRETHFLQHVAQFS